MKTCKDCEHFGGRAIFDYNGRGKVPCLNHLFKGVYPEDSICNHFERHLPFYYRNDYLRKIITDILWKLGKKKVIK